MSKHSGRKFTSEKFNSVYKKWLLQSFPQAFDGSFKPLAVGILEQLSGHLPAHISKTSLRITLRWYTSELNYLRNILKSNYRINLDGSDAQLITDPEREAAAERINAIQNRRGAWKVKNNNKNQVPVNN